MPDHLERPLLDEACAPLESDTDVGADLCEAQVGCPPRVEAVCARKVAAQSPAGDCVGVVLPEHEVKGVPQPQVLHDLHQEANQEE